MSLRRRTNANRRGKSSAGLYPIFAVDLTGQAAAEADGASVTGSPFSAGGYEASSGNYALLGSAQAIARVPRTWLFRLDAPTADTTRAVIRARAAEWSLGQTTSGLFFADGSAAIKVSGTGTLSSGQHVIGVSYNSTGSGSGTATIYVDGEQYATGTASDGWGNPAYADLILGALNTVGGQLWDAKQYEIAVYEYLAAAHVRAATARLMAPVVDVSFGTSGEVTSAGGTVTGSPYFGPYIASSGNYAEIATAAALARVPRTWLFRVGAPTADTTRAIVRARAAEWSLGQTTSGLFFADGSGGVVVSGTGTLSPGQHVIGLTYDAVDNGSGTVTVYVDGAQYMTGTAGSGWGDPSAGTALLFGALNTVGGQLWDGGIYRAVCYDQALSGDMVAVLGALV